MILYVCGPMTGMPDLNYPAFFNAEEALIEAGFEVLNPAKNKGPHQIDYMKQGITQVCQADGLALLDGWEKSAGSMQERTIAFWLSITIAPVWVWLG